MKFLVSEISFFLDQRSSRRNLQALLKYTVFLAAVILVFSIAFHVIMLYVEGREFSYISGLYWVLVVMSTLGFGDITFESDIGRAFSILVILSGVILLLIMLPFTFIRFFYAPWLEAQLHARSPREVPPETRGHIVICKFDTVTPNLIKRLTRQNIPYFVLEKDPARAAEMMQDEISVIQGDPESVATYRRLNIREARMVIANMSDTENTNIVLTVREAAPSVPITAIAESEDSVDILELSGADHVLALKQLLGEKLANRINIGKERAYVVGRAGDRVIVEFTVHQTRYAGMTLAETGFRAATGTNIIGVWERGKLQEAAADLKLTESSVVAAIGSETQIAALNELLGQEERPHSSPVLIIGGGKVGLSAAHSLKAAGKTVYMVDEKRELRRVLAGIPDRLTIGNAADRRVLEKGGLNESSLVVLSTHDDAVNIYLSIYCRRLRPDIRIVSRITHEHNVEALHRAGADMVLSYAHLGAESLISLIQGRDSVVMGEDVEFSVVAVPKDLVGKTLAQSDIGRKTGVIVLAIQDHGRSTRDPLPDHILPEGGQISILGSAAQLETFERTFG